MPLIRAALEIASQAFSSSSPHIEPLVAARQSTKIASGGHPFDHTDRRRRRSNARRSRNAARCSNAQYAATLQIARLSAAPQTSRDGRSFSAIGISISFDRLGMGNDRARRILGEFGPAKLHKSE
jgi:hypothetical protein